jgi:hypothetical protein
MGVVLLLAQSLMILQVEAHWVHGATPGGGVGFGLGLIK